MKWFVCLLAYVHLNKVIKVLVHVRSALRVLVLWSLEIKKTSAWPVPLWGQFCLSLPFLMAAIVRSHFPLLRLVATYSLKRNLVAEVKTPSVWYRGVKTSMKTSMHRCFWNFLNHRCFFSTIDVSVPSLLRKKAKERYVKEQIFFHFFYYNIKVLLLLFFSNRTLPD